MDQIQYIRRCNLYVTGQSGDGLDLSNLHIKFSIKKSDAQTPNAAEITVYNLSDTTAQFIRKEFTRVTLQAGYESNIGVIFDGNIKQCRIGRENGTDTYINISAGDGDDAYNFAVVSGTLAAGATQADQIAASANAMNSRGVTLGYVGSTPDAVLPRGKVLFGMARDYLRSSSASSSATWSIQDGKIQVVERTAVLPDQAVRLTSKSGLIGTPEQTEKGIAIRCLLNPQIKAAGRVQIDQSNVQEAAIPTAQKGSAVNDPPAIASDGLYRVLVVEYVGDNRGNDWYSDLTCLAMDDSAVPADQVSPQ
tara:strand:+ start:2597 stop:3517 length:921 start_codon:yes stop_codon:yes gene_type:complete